MYGGGAHLLGEKKKRPRARHMGGHTDPRGSSSSDGPSLRHDGRIERPDISGQQYAQSMVEAPGRILSYSEPQRSYSLDHGIDVAQGNTPSSWSTTHNPATHNPATRHEQAYPAQITNARQDYADQGVLDSDVSHTYDGSLPIPVSSSSYYGNSFVDKNLVNRSSANFSKHEYSSNDPQLERRNTVANDTSCWSHGTNQGPEEAYCSWVNLSRPQHDEYCDGIRRPSDGLDQECPSRDRINWKAGDAFPPELGGDSQQVHDHRRQEHAVGPPYRPSSGMQSHPIETGSLDMYDTPDYNVAWEKKSNTVIANIGGVDYQYPASTIDEGYQETLPSTSPSSGSRSSTNFDQENYHANEDQQWSEYRNDSSASAHATGWVGSNNTEFEVQVDIWQDGYRHKNAPPRLNDRTLLLDTQCRESNWVSRTVVNLLQAKTRRLSDVREFSCVNRQPMIASQLTTLCFRSVEGGKTKVADFLVAQIEVDFEILLGADDISRFRMLSASQQPRPRFMGLVPKKKTPGEREKFVQQIAAHDKAREEHDQKLREKALRLQQQKPGGESSRHHNSSKKKS